MSISFEEIPASVRKPGRYLEFNTRLAARGLPADRQSVLLIGQGNEAAISDASFDGTGTNDLATAGTFTGTSRKAFVVEIQTAGTSETAGTFRWSSDGGKSWDASGVSITGSAQTLTLGVTVEFDTTYGYTAGDKWSFYADPPAADTELTPVEIFSVADAKSRFGAGSQLALMAEAAYAANRYVALHAVMQDEAASGAVAASLTGAVTSGSAAGVLTLWIGNKKVTVAVTATDTAQIIANAVAAAVNAQEDYPVRASVSDDDLTLTCKWAGASGNEIAVEYSVTNSCAAIAFATANLVSGATDPTITEALTVVEPGNYDILVSGYVGAGADLATHLDTVSGPIEQRPAIGIIGYVGAAASGIAAAAAINSGRVSIPLLKASKSPAWQIAAAYASVLAFEEDPARPLNTVALTGIAAPSVANGLTRTEQETLLYGGVTPLEAGNDAIVRIVRAISTYTTNAEGSDDPALLDITTIRTLDYVREAVRARISARFAQAKLNTRTTERVRAEIYDVLRLLENEEIVENVDALFDDLVVERDEADPNRVNAQIPADVVNGLHVFAGRIDLIL